MNLPEWNTFISNYRSLCAKTSTMMRARNWHVEVRGHNSPYMSHQHIHFSHVCADLGTDTVVVGCKEPHRTIVLTNTAQIKAWEKLGGEWSLLWEMQPFKAPKHYQLVHSPIPPQMAGKLVERFKELHLPISNYYSHAIWWVPVVAAYVDRAFWDGHEHKHDLFRPVFAHERECRVFVPTGERPPAIWYKQEATPITGVYSPAEGGRIYRIWRPEEEPEPEKQPQEEEESLEDLEELEDDEE